mmetsp:Transcript_78423/g.199396  ORF Transcript_78423/g.199396 Transcript_78423/m.199396 type:complete len:137 (+) Transcript_78423:59-469(+)
MVAQLARSLCACVLLAILGGGDAVAVVAADGGASQLRGAQASTTRSCMDIYKKCVSRKSKLCRSFGVPLYHSDCMSAIQAKCWKTPYMLGQVNSTGYWRSACSDCDEQYSDGKSLCSRCAATLENLELAANACPAR